MRRPPGGGRAVLPGVFLAAAALLGTASAGLAANGAAPLTEAEQAWLDARPALRVGNNPNFEPIDFDDERGRPAGVAAEVMALVQKKLDLRLEYLPHQSWDEAFEALQKGEIDVLLQAGRSPEREALFLFTQPYFSFRSVVVVRNDVPFVPNVEALLDRKFALVKNYNETNLMRASYPELDVRMVDSVEDALQSVSSGEVDATIGNIAVLHYKILKLGLTNLKVATTADSEAERYVQMAVRKDAPELVSILNKGLAAITPAERKAINDRWFTVEIERGLDPKRVVLWTAWAGAGIALLSLFVVWWLRRLRLEIDYRRESEARTAAAEQLLRLVTDTIPGLIVHTAVKPEKGARREWRFMSGQMPVRYGLDIEWARQHDLFDFIVEEDQARVHGTMVAAMKTLEPWQMTYRVRLPDGHLRWHHNEAILRREPDGTTLVTSYVSDITERMQLEADLAEAKEHAEAAESRLRDFTDSVPGMVLQVVVAEDLAMKVEFITGRMLPGYGFDREVFVKDLMKLWDVIIPEDRDAAESAIWSSIKNLQPLQIAYRIRIPSGEIRWNLNETFSRLEPRGVVITSYVSDITERKRLEEQLGSAEQQLRLVTEAIPGFILHTHIGADGFKPDVRFASGQLSRRYGIDSRHWLSFEHQLAFMVEEDRDATLQAMLEAVKLRKSFTVTYRVRLPNGEVRWNLHEANVKPEPDGSTSIISYINDITERKELEHQLAVAKEQAETASRTKGEFLANMSHEIRTPLNAVIGLSYLATRGDAPPRTRDYLDKIKSSAQALLGIVNDILDVSKIEAGKLTLERTAFSLDEVLTHLSDVVSHKASEKGIELLFSVPRELPHELFGDPLRLGQVLLNLASNALKFTEKGQIVIAVEESRRDDRRVWLEFSVSDSGIGMTAEQLGRLFKAFSQADSSTTRKYGGTGLGLSISQSLVEKMGGQIEVASEAGQGSVFSFCVPFELGSGTPISAPGLAPLAGLRVLAADDSSTSRAIVMSCLQSFKFDAVGVASGRATVEALREAAAAGRPFRVVLLDWRMPDLAGEELVREIRALKLQPAPALVVVSGHTREELATRADALNLDGVVNKPFNASFLLETILNAVGASVASATLPPAEEAPALQPGRLVGSRVLVVEDNHMNQQVVRELLERAGATVALANNGREALDRVGEAGFDLILMDLQMPEVGGIEAAETLRASGYAVPIVAMTASAMPGDEQRCLDAGMNDYLSKPINLERLSGVLARFLRLAEPGVAPAPATAPRGAAATRPVAPELPQLMDTLREQLTTSDSSAVDTLDRIRQALSGAPGSRSFRELVRLVDTFSFEAALHKLDQARVDLGLGPRSDGR
jgi:signal transduction histidine kinase/CheY-like chemotaxis protein/ABC-type amino acid transport substrate-binding protein